MDTSPEAAAAVLHGLFGWAGGGTVSAELIEVSVKSPSGRWNSEHVDADTLRSMDTVKQMAEWSATGRETYVGCVGLTSRPTVRWRRGSAALRGHAGALWLDVDVQAPGREGPEYFDSVEDAVSAVDACLGSELAEASLVVGSGWGVQYWIPLRKPVSGKLASQTVRVLVGMVGECTGHKIDRVWDVTRVMRMPGTWNWRAGPDPESARPTGVLRWPERSGADGRPLERLELANVIAEIARLVGDVGSPSVDDVGAAAVLERLLERYGGTAGAADSDPGAYAGDWVGDIERLAYESLTWGEVLEPWGWHCVNGSGGWLGPDEHEQIWERPGKELGPGPGSGPEGRGDRSAVVYADRPELLVVFTDSFATGFSAGLRGSGHRGEGAGVGVISKWRAWVDLAWDGDEAKALAAVAGGGTGSGGPGDLVAEKLGEAWTDETDWMKDWVETLAAGVMEAHGREAGVGLPTESMLGYDPTELARSWEQGREP